MPNGRPTEYGSEVLEQARHYLENYADEPYSDKIPSAVGLAKALNLSRSTIYLWGTQEGKEEFSDILERVQDSQEHKLINSGLSGDFNPTITKLILTKHGYTDRSELTGKDDKPLIPEISDMELMRRAAFVLAVALKGEPGADGT